MQIENDIEKYLVRQIKRIGALCYKFTSPGTRGVPDRIILYQGNVFFVELKRPGGKPRKDQLKTIEKFKEQLIPVFVIDSKQGVDTLIYAMQSGIARVMPDMPCKKE
ncbi:TPA: VRR-NUC domain-containing protein [Enterococcus faecalis]|nr:VRR-NUC domain-containing protein [Enterococcus faecalis]HAP5496787.1 VRR-NUC domain-containing protein [Enterococcus faecalis]